MDLHVLGFCRPTSLSFVGVLHPTRSVQRSSTFNVLVHVFFSVYHKMGYMEIVKEIVNRAAHVSMMSAVYDVMQRPEYITRGVLLCMPLLLGSPDMTPQPMRTCA